MKLNNIPEELTLPLRLSIIGSLIDGEKSFNELKKLTNSSDGNLSVQLKNLELKGYIVSEKRWYITKKITIYKVTSFGINQIKEYLILIETILNK